MEEDGSLLNHGEFDWSEVTEVLWELFSEYIPRWVLAETPVIIRGPLGEKLTWVVSSTRHVFPEVIEIDPARWKNSWWAQAEVPHPANRKLSRHQQDAIRMGWWYLDHELKTGIQRTNMTGS